jgi:hypothetical protein
MSAFREVIQDGEETIPSRTGKVFMKEQVRRIA